MVAIDISNQQRALKIDRDALRSAVNWVLADAGIEEAQISVALVNNETIAELNERYLNHEGPTDVLSFVLEHSKSRLEGEIVASTETAIREAKRFGWSPADELLLYVVHGMLHLVGHDDQNPKSRRAMRHEEKRCLAAFGLKPRYSARTTAASPARRPRRTNQSGRRTVHSNRRTVR